MINDWRIDIERGQALAFPEITLFQEGEDEVGDKLIHTLREHTLIRPHPQFSILVDDVRYRIQRQSSTEFVVRRINPVLLEPHELGFAPPVIRAMLDTRLRQGGLFVVTGATGSGKSTTMASVVREHLRTEGGYCHALEDPPEYNLQGKHGQRGYCDQIEVIDSEDFDRRVRESYRSFFSRSQGILLLGEIRDEITAVAASRAALSGFMVAATLHAESVVAAIQKFLNYLGADDSHSKRGLFADCLRLLVFQEWREDRIHADTLEMSSQARRAIEQCTYTNLLEEMRQFKVKARIND